MIPIMNFYNASTALEDILSSISLRWRLYQIFYSEYLL